MFFETASEWVSELKQLGKLEGKSEDETKRLALEYEKKLEEFFNAEVMKTLDKYGKAADFERMLLFDTQYTHKFLNQTIPAYYNYRAEVFARAKKEILK